MSEVSKVMKEAEAAVETDEDIIKDFKEFASTVYKADKDQIELRKRMRSFASGEQWSDDYKKMRGTGRAYQTYNLIELFRNAIVNPFITNPYSIKWTSKSERSDTPDHNRLLEIANQWLMNVSEFSDLPGSVANGLVDAVETGVGYFYVSDVKDVDGESKVKVYPVPDSTMVIFDCNSIEIDGSDANKAAVVTVYAKDVAEQLYGDTGALEKGYGTEPYLVSNFGDAWSCPDGSVLLVRYYTRDIKNKIVHIYDMIGNKIVRRAEIKSSYIPIIPVYGSQSYANKRRVYKGITEKLQSAQEAFNFAGSNLIERLARAPKNQLIAAKEAISGNEEYYRNMDKSLNPLLVYNSTSKGSPTTPVPAPTRVNNSIQTEDITSIMKSQMDIMSTIVGIPLTGIADKGNSNETAESVRIRTSSNESNISHFEAHAKKSMQHLGDILKDWFKIDAAVEMGEVDTGFMVTVIGDGPQQFSTKMENREQLIALAKFFPDTVKPLFAVAIAKSMTEVPQIQEMLPALANILPPDAYKTNPMVQQLQTQMQQMQAQTSKEMADKDAQIKELNNQLLMANYNTDMNAKIAKLNADTKIQIENLKAQSKSDIEVQKQVAELDKLRIDQENKLKADQMAYINSLQNKY